VRLGFRRINGLREAHGRRIADVRSQFGRFSSVEEFHRATGIPVSVVRRLAEADAFTSLGLSRRQALWQALELRDDLLPLHPPRLSVATPPSLPQMPLGQEVMIDYSTGGLSLKAHPLALNRDELTQRGVITAAQLQQKHSGWVKVAGLVLIRQRPGTASGIVFETIEDETGVVNLIVRPNIYERFRPAARHAGLLQAEGYVERQDNVIHVMALKMYDLSHLLAGYRLESRDFH
jgi:error-prone DNA polymerase